MVQYSARDETDKPVKPHLLQRGYVHNMLKIGFSFHSFLQLRIRASENRRKLYIRLP